MTSAPAILVQQVSHRYGDRLALEGVCLDVARGTIFGLLGPNGGGKTTLFRLLATLLPIQRGSARLEGVDVAADPASVRRLIGVTFQSPSLDGKLTVRENLACHGRLYGFSGAALRRWITETTEPLEVVDRLGDLVETLSGGLKRRVEIAKSLLHRPRILLLDEPSTGLDPGIRHELWRILRSLVAPGEMTILVTTHLLEEAERCDCLAILDRGRIVVSGRPDELRRQVGGDCITITTATPEALGRELQEAFQVPVQAVDRELRIEQPEGHELVREIMRRFGPQVQSITLGRPTLEDVFIHHTGRRLSDEAETRPPAERH